MNKIKPDTCTQTKKLICDWSNKKIYLIHHRLLKIYVKHGMVVEEIHEIISFKENKWLEKYILFNTQNQNIAKTNFEKDLSKLLVNTASGKLMENVRNRLKIDFIEKHVH